jgi:magnesium transporter
LTAPPSPSENFDGARLRLQELAAEGRLEDAWDVLDDLAPSDVADLLRDLHPSDVADVVEALESDEERVALMQALPAELASEALAEMDEGEDPGDLLAAMDPTVGAQLLQELEYDDAVDLVAELEPDEQAKILAALPVEEAGEIRGLLRYDEESAGRIMNTSLVSIEGELTAGEAIAEVRRKGQEVEDFYTVFVVDRERHLMGTVSLHDLILADPRHPVTDLIEPPLASVLPSEDQEEVGRLMSRYNMVSIPVVNESGVLLGRITFDDVLDVLEAEQTEDILLLAGTSDEEDLGGDWHEAVRARLPWLLVNLLTAAAASSMVILFHDAVDAIWFLAFIMPMVAGLGGNSGTQSLAVTVRRIALSPGPVGRRLGTLWKEGLVGLVNGMAVGLLAAGAAMVAVHYLALNPRLPLVVLLAFWWNIGLASFNGAMIPTVLHRLGVDPAVASSIFVTALTDMTGFFLLLWLASALLL